MKVQGGGLAIGFGGPHILGAKGRGRMFRILLISFRVLTTGLAGQGPRLSAEIQRGGQPARLLFRV